MGNAGSSICFRSVDGSLFLSTYACLPGSLVGLKALHKAWVLGFIRG